MLRTFRHRSTLLLRLLVLAVVAFGTVGGTLASALGELHELSHTQHSPLAHQDLTAETGHGDEDTGARFLHALVHCGHCHGQGGMLPLALSGWDALPYPIRVHTLTSVAPRLSAPAQSLLRPPIPA